MFTLDIKNIEIKFGKIQKKGGEEKSNFRNFVCLLISNHEMKKVGFIMEILFLIVSFIAIGFGFYCLAKENSVTGLYKTFNVYGRFTAYMSLLPLPGIIFFVIGIVKLDWTSILCGIIGLLTGILIWVRAFKKCPAFLKGALPFSMIVSGFGVAFKISLFFMAFMIKTWWHFEKPLEVEDEYGNHYYVKDGHVYDSFGSHVGEVDPKDSNRVIMKK